MNTATATRYIYHEFEYSEEIKDVSSMGEAVEWAEKYALEGDYDNPTGLWIDGSVCAVDNGEEIAEEKFSVWLPPDEEKAIEAAGGDHECEHEWVSTVKIDGGMEENPGVFGLAGAAILCVCHCKKCNISRREISGDTNEAGNRDSVEYRMTVE